jgi:hypothetical protein
MLYCLLSRFYTFVCANKTFKTIALHCETLSDIFDCDNFSSVISGSEINDLYYWVKQQYFFHLLFHMHLNLDPTIPHDGGHCGSSKCLNVDIYDVTYL